MIKKTLLFLTAIVPFIAVSQSWTTTPAPISGDRYDDIYFHTVEIGWAVRGDGSVFKTTDGGQTWSLQFFDSNRYFRSVDFINADIGFAGTLDSALYKTTDGGQTWTEIQDLIPTPMPGICGLSHSGNNVYGVGLFAYPAYFIKSIDQGQTWTYTDLSNLADGLVECHFLDDNTGFISGVGANGRAVILKTTDGGSSWTEVFNSQNGTQYVWKLDFLNSQVAYGAIEAFSGPAEIVKTTDGGDTWTKHTVSATYLDLQGIGFMNQDTGWVGPRMNPMYATYDGGLTWQIDNSLYTGVNRFFRWNDNLLYASGTGVYKFGNAVTEIESPTFDIKHSITDISPNPFTESLTFKVHIERNTTARLDMYASDGKHVVNLHEGRLMQGEHSFSLNEESASSLSKGQYLIVLRTNEGFISRQVIHS